MKKKSHDEKIKRDESRMFKVKISETKVVENWKQINIKMFLKKENVKNGWKQKLPVFKERHYAVFVTEKGKEKIKN